MPQDKGVCPCKKTVGGKMICCDGCRWWHHYKCENLTSAVVNTIDVFYCKRCRKNRGAKIIYYPGVGPENQDPSKKSRSKYIFEESETDSESDSTQVAQHGSKDNIENEPAPGPSGTNRQEPLAEITNNSRQSSQENFATAVQVPQGAIATTSQAAGQSSESSSSDDSLSEEEYEIMTVLGIRGRGPGTEYLIRWKGYPKYRDEWVNEENCSGCVPEINKFRHSRGLASCKLVARGGASATKPGAKYNYDNWVTMEQIMSAVRTFDRFPYSRAIEIKQFNYSLDLLQSDAIYIIMIGTHFIVSLTIVEESTSYVADGGNNCLANINLQNEIKDTLETSIKPIPFNQQTGIDHCGSSAVALALEFKRIYQTMDFPREITVNRSDQANLLHSLASLLM